MSLSEPEVRTEADAVVVTIRSASPAWRERALELRCTHDSVEITLEARGAGMNPKLFNSFLDGTKSAIEMCAVANATGLTVHVTSPRGASTADDTDPASLPPRQSRTIRQRQRSGTA